MELSPKERRFVAEFLKDQNAKQAAIRAGYSPKTAETQGPRLYRKVQVRDACDRELEKIKKDSLLTAQLVREKAYALLTFDPRKAFNEDGTMKSATEMPDDLVMALTDIEVDDTGETVKTKKIKFTNRVQAVDAAARILGLLRVEVTGKGGSPLVPATPIDFSRIDDAMLRAIAGMRVNGNGKST
jgi:phage terminase small subunit